MMVAVGVNHHLTTRNPYRQMQRDEDKGQDKKTVVVGTIEHGGVYHRALNASMIFGTIASSSRDHVATHFVGTIVGAVAIAYNAQHFVEGEKNVAGICRKLILYYLWLMGWMTTKKGTLTKKIRRRW